MAMTSSIKSVIKETENNKEEDVPIGDANAPEEDEESIEASQPTATGFRFQRPELPPLAQAKSIVNTVHVRIWNSTVTVAQAKFFMENDYDIPIMVCSCGTIGKFLECKCHKRRQRQVTGLENALLRTLALGATQK